MTHLCLLGDANSVHVRRWAGEMRVRGYRVSVVTARPDESLEGVEQRVLAPVSRSVDWLFRVAEARRAVEALAPDIVHAHYVTSYGHLGARCGRHPLVMTAWGTDLLVTPRDSALMRWLTGWSLRRADLITGDSADLMDAVAAYHPPGEQRLIHWGVDLAKFRPAPWGEKTGFQIVSLRSWEPNYRIDTIVRAAARLMQRRPHAGAHLHLLGGGPLETTLRELVAALGIGDQVTFHGRVGDAAMGAVLGACKVSVSVPASDATSVSVLESMACGLPVVASDLPANREWLGTGDGLLLASGDPEGLADALTALCDDDERARRIGERHHARIQRDGARSSQMDTMAALYDRLLARRGQPVAAMEGRR